MSSRFPAPTASVAGSDSRPVFMGDDTFTQASIDRLEHELAALTVRLEAATHRQLAILRELEPTGFWAEQGARSFAQRRQQECSLAEVAHRSERCARGGKRPERASRFSQLEDRARAGRGARQAARGTRARQPARDRRRVRRGAALVLEGARADAGGGAANEAVLLDMALHATADHLEQICRGIRAADRDEQLARDVETRWVRERAGDHGMVRIEAQLHPDEAAIVWAAIERARARRSFPRSRRSIPSR